MALRIRVVLVRPRRGGNVGSVARAMKNFGLSDLVLVAPRTRLGVTAERMAAHAVDVLRGHRVVPDLAAALSDTTLAVGTVGRKLAAPERAAAPRELVSEVLAEAGTGRVALVFGPEDHGLANADLDQCQRQMCIPTDEYASLNLAQAVVVCAYELHLASVGAPTAPRTKARTPRRRVRDADAKAASGAEREALFVHLEASLAEIGFLSEQNPTHIMRDIRELFGRAGLTRRDVRVWRGLARQVGWAGRRITEKR